MNNTTTRSIARPMLKMAALLASAVLGLSPARALTLVGTFNGTTRYVSKSGNDSNGGTSWADAKLTI